MIDEKDLEFIEKRSFFARWWTVVGSIMLAVLGGMALWFFVRVPNFINPFHVIRKNRDSAHYLQKKMPKMI